MNTRPTTPFDEKSDSRFLRFLYFPFWGAPLRFIMTRKFVSKLGGAYMDSSFSRRRIPGFIKSNKIDMSDYEDRTYISFNDFFTRKILPGKRPFSKAAADFCSPADSRLSAFRATEDGKFTVKGHLSLPEGNLVPNNIGRLLFPGVEKHLNSVLFHDYRAVSRALDQFVLGKDGSFIFIPAFLFQRVISHQLQKGNTVIFAPRARR